MIKSKILTSHTGYSLADIFNKELETGNVYKNSIQYSMSNNMYSVFFLYEAKAEPERKQCPTCQGYGKPTCPQCLGKTFIIE